MLGSTKLHVMHLREREAEVTWWLDWLQRQKTQDILVNKRVLCVTKRVLYRTDSGACQWRVADDVQRRVITTPAAAVAAAPRVNANQLNTLHAWLRQLRSKLPLLSSHTDAASVCNWRHQSSHFTSDTSEVRHETHWSVSCIGTQLRITDH